MGRFHYYIFPGLTSALSAVSIFLENPKKRGVTVTSFLYLMFEVFVRYLEEFNYIHRTTGFETFVFMICSAALLYLLRIVKHQKSNLWFFLPPSFGKSKITDDKRHYCPHRGSCWDDIINNTAKYFGFGVLVQWLRATVPKFRKILKEPSLLNPFNLKTLKLGVFTGLYVMTYKMTSCFLCRYRKEDSPLHAIPSGLLAGLAYIIRPDLTVILIAICNLLTLSEYHFKDKGLLPKWPFSEVAYIIASGILFHSQMVIPNCTPKQFVNLMHSFSYGKSTEINKRLWDYIAKSQELKKLASL
ncbi:transmembrane protein 135-like [Nilaparvata lugens]|nr:transmembrane protein 135-like [Nilaparvata lugens]